MPLPLHEHPEAVVNEAELRATIRGALETIRAGDKLEPAQLEPFFGHTPDEGEIDAAHNRLEALGGFPLEDATEMVFMFLSSLPPGDNPLHEQQASVDEVVAAAEGGASLSVAARFELGVLSPVHERILVQAVADGVVDRSALLACVYDGARLTELLGDRAKVEQAVAFRTTDANGMPTSAPAAGGMLVRDAVSIETPGAPFRMWITNETELCMALGEPDTMKWLNDTLGDDGVLWDVGANVGFFALYAAAAKPSARCVAFEPAPHNFARLNENIRLNGLNERVTAFPVACSDASGFDTFRMSFFHAGGWSQQGLLDAEKAGYTGAEQPFPIGCITFTLDDCIASAPLAEAPPTHLKIDVDGPELRVLAGAKRLLASPRLRHLLVELRHASDEEAVDAIVGPAGFVRTGDEVVGLGNRLWVKEG